MGRKVTFSLFLAVVICCPVATALAGVQKTIPDVPSYIWYGGCGPTAGGMVTGYWDAHGYPDLIPGASNTWYGNPSDWPGGDSNRDPVHAMIASAGYFADYWPTPDRTPPPPLHADDCLADFMWTSRYPMGQGWSYDSMQGVGLTDYAKYRGYPYATSGYSYFDGLWAVLVGEIDANRPMEFYVDRSADGIPDHFVTVVGYDDTPGALQYRAYNTYDLDMHWYSFDVVASGRAYGVESGTTFNPLPEPATMALLALGGALLAFRRNRRAARSS